MSFGNPNIATYNNLVTTAANSVTVLVALGTNWNAVGSTSSVDARDNTGTNPTVDTGVPIYLSNGIKLVDNNPYFWGGLITSPMDITSTGDVLTNPDMRVWTGCNAYGTKYATHNLGTNAKTQTAYGHATVAGSGVILFAATSKGEGHVMYAMSDLLPVEVVPEPGSLAIFRPQSCKLGICSTQKVIMTSHCS